MTAYRVYQVDAFTTERFRGNPAGVVPKTPVAGNANGPLGAYLARHKLVDRADPSLSFRGMQGEAIGRTGIVDVEVELDKGAPVKVRVGGRAVIVFQTALTL